MRSICVFCGSRPGDSPAYLELASECGRLLAARGLRLVYGGGSVGLMGALADSVLAHGGEVVGVIPGHLLAREVGHRGLTDLRVVTTMQERKALMGELSDGYLTLPGGLGTLDELFEVWTWYQLGLSRKPIALLDFGGFFRPLLDFLDAATAHGFLSPEQRQTLHVGHDLAFVLDELDAAIASAAA